MDADRIRQAVRVVANILQQCVQGCDEFHEGGVVLEAAKAYADLLDGPTDEDIRAGGARLCTPDAHVWNPLPEGFDPPCISHFIEARAVLEAALMTEEEE